MKHAVVVVVKVFFFSSEEGALHSLGSSVWPEVQVQTHAPPFLCESPPPWPAPLSLAARLNSSDQALLM